MNSNRIIGIVAISLSFVSVLLSSMAMTMTFFPESRAAAFFAHPLRELNVMYACAGKSNDQLSRASPSL